MTNIFRTILIIIVNSVLLIRSAFRRKKRCTCAGQLQGKTVLVTGGTSGLGRETARLLAQRGARVLITGRDGTRAARVAGELAQTLGQATIIPKQLDLASLHSVRVFAADILASEARLDVLINNAGVVDRSQDQTADGIVEDLQVNYFGPFLLTLLLLPLLLRSVPSRVINVTSVLHLVGSLDVDRINSPRWYGPVRTYAAGKLCQVSWSRELSHRVHFHGVSVNAVHPGVVHTGIVPPRSRLCAALFSVWCRCSGRSAEEGAQTVLHVAVSARAGVSADAGVAHLMNTGQYWTECDVTQPALQTEDVLLARRLWDYSINLVGYEPQTETEKVITKYM